MTLSAPLRASWFQRFLLPGFAFKAVVIGGSCATGRELAAFFFGSGPWGGLFAMALVTAVWSLFAAATFAFAQAAAAHAYRSFRERRARPGRRSRDYVLPLPAWYAVRAARGPSRSARAF